MSSKNTLSGVACGIGAGVLWGLAFIAPNAVEPYSAVDLVMLNYTTFGVVSLILMGVSARFRPTGMTKRQLKTGLFLGIFGYVLYYICVAFSVRLAGPTIAPLIIGALPLTLAIYGNFKEKNANNRLAWHWLLIPLCFLFVGLICIYASSLLQPSTLQKAHDLILGSILAFGAHAIWFVYALINSRIMLDENAPSELSWTSIQGIGAIIGVMPLIVIASIFGLSNLPTIGIWHSDGARFIFWGMFVGIAGSWGGQYLWSMASKRLSLALSAQLIVSETIFGLIYGFLWFARWPTPLEMIGASLLISGVATGVWMMSAKQNA